MTPWAFEEGDIVLLRVKHAECRALVVKVHERHPQGRGHCCSRQTVTILQSDTSSGREQLHFHCVPGVDVEPYLARDHVVGIIGTTLEVAIVSVQHAVDYEGRSPMRYYVAPTDGAALDVAGLQALLQRDLGVLDGGGGVGPFCAEDFTRVARSPAPTTDHLDGGIYNLLEEILTGARPGGKRAASACASSWGGTKPAKKARASPPRPNLLATAIASLPPGALLALIPKSHCVTVRSVSRAVRAALETARYPVHLGTNAAGTADWVRQLDAKRRAWFEQGIRGPPADADETAVADFTAALARWSVTGLSLTCDVQLCRAASVADVLHMAGSSLTCLNVRGLENSVAGVALRSMAMEKALAQCTRLTSLDISRNPTCQHDWLFAMSGRRDRSLFGLWTHGTGLGGGLRALVSLNLAKNRLTDTVVELLAEMLPEMPGLERLNLRQALGWRASCGGMPALGNGLTQLTRLQYLNLGKMGRYGIKAGSLVALAPALARCTALTWLSLKACSLEEESLVAENNAVVAALRPLTALRVLKLKKNTLGGGGANVVGPMLAQYASLKSLDLSWSSIDGDVYWLAVGLAAAPALAWLRLANNHLRSSGGEQLGRHLVHCTSLTALDMEACSLRDEGIWHLAPALASLPRLASLNVRCNGFGFEGAEALAANLAASSSLCVLEMGMNSIGAGWATGQPCVRTGNFAQYLRRFAVLQWLDVSHIHLGDGGATTLAEELAACRALKGVDVSFNHVYQAGAEELLRRVEGMEPPARPRLCLGGHAVDTQWFEALSEEQRWCLTGSHHSASTWGLARRPMV